MDALFNGSKKETKKNMTLSPIKNIQESIKYLPPLLQDAIFEWNLPLDKLKSCWTCAVFFFLFLETFIFCNIFKTLFYANA